MLSLDAAWRTRPATVRADAGARTDAPVDGHTGMTAKRDAGAQPACDANGRPDRAILVHCLHVFRACAHDAVPALADHALHHRVSAARGESAFSIPCVPDCGAP
ncbi:hypothetical protein [Burkholderia sp. F1]|uniref:hypothetical protein n=1 Tax=Burkholderia sp. F1 TaxID=3366817 RepID=UPI003D7573F4